MTRATLSPLHPLNNTPVKPAIAFVHGVIHHAVQLNIGVPEIGSA